MFIILHCGDQTATTLVEASSSSPTTSFRQGVSLCSVLSPILALGPNLDLCTGTSSPKQRQTPMGSLDMRLTRRRMSRTINWWLLPSVTQRRFQRVNCRTYPGGCCGRVCHRAPVRGMCVTSGRQQYHQLGRATRHGWPSAQAGCFFSFYQCIPSCSTSF